MILRGNLGLWVARRGLLRRDQVPAAPRQRLAERSKGQKVFDVSRRLAVAIWRGASSAAYWVGDAITPEAPSPSASQATGAGSVERR